MCLYFVVSIRALFSRRAVLPLENTDEYASCGWMIQMLHSKRKACLKFVLSKQLFLNDFRMRERIENVMKWTFSSLRRVCVKCWSIKLDPNHSANSLLIPLVHYHSLTHFLKFYTYTCHGRETSFSNRYAVRYSLAATLFALSP